MAKSYKRNLIFHRIFISIKIVDMEQFQTLCIPSSFTDFLFFILTEYFFKKRDTNFYVEKNSVVTKPEYFIMSRFSKLN